MGKHLTGGDVRRPGKISGKISGSSSGDSGIVLLRPFSNADKRNFESCCLERLSSGFSVRPHYFRFFVIRETGRGRSLFFIFCSSYAMDIYQGWWEGLIRM